MLCRLSEGGGRVRGMQIILRKGFLSKYRGFPDFGYPQWIEWAGRKIFPPIA
jgi:hypothetical protein